MQFSNKSTLAGPFHVSKPQIYNPIFTPSIRSVMPISPLKVSKSSSVEKSPKSPIICLTEDLEADLPCEISSIYELVQQDELGRGSFARIRHIRLKGKPSIQLALKSMEKRPLQERCMTDQAIREVEFQQKASTHPNIVYMCDVFEDISHIHMVLEYVPFGNLASYRYLSQSTVLSILSQIASALRYLHDILRVVHRDVKPDNILVSSREPHFQVKLTDFGWCAPLFGPPLVGKAGSMAFMAPEVACGGFHGPPCDVWSLGMTLRALLNGEILNFEHKAMLSPIPSQRPTAAQLAFKFPKN